MHTRSQATVAFEWGRKMEIIRLLVHKIELGRKDIKVTFRIMHEKHNSGVPPIVVTILRSDRGKNRSSAA
jgi:hypothetical protein